MTELCFKCNKSVLAGCGYYYLGNCFHARCLCCSTCGGKLVGKPFLTNQSNKGNKIFCDEECTRNYVLICDDVPNEPMQPSITVNCHPPPNEMYSGLGSPDEPLFIPTLRSSPVPIGSSNRMYRTDSLSSDLSGTSHTSDNSYTHDANKKPKKRILKHPHEKKNGHRSKHVHWRLDEVVDSKYEGDDTSLDSNDTYAKIPDIPSKRHNQGWNETDQMSWKDNPQWNSRSEVIAEDGTPDIDMPFDESCSAEDTSVPFAYHPRLPDIPSHQITISSSDDNSTPLLVDRLKQVQLQDAPTGLQAPSPQIDSPIQSAEDDFILSLSPANNPATLTSTPVVYRKNGVTSNNSMPPVLKIRDSMVCELEESVYDNKPNMFQFPDTSCNGSPGTSKKASGGIQQLSPLPEDVSSLPPVLKISETSQLIESSGRSDSDYMFSLTTCHLDKDMMGQNIPVTSSLQTHEQSPSTSLSSSSSGDIRTVPLNTSNPPFTHTNSDSDLSTANDFLTKKQSLMNPSNGSTSSLPVNFSSYMNQSKLQDNAKMPSTLAYHGSPSNGCCHVSTSSLPVMTNGKVSSLDDPDDIDTPIGDHETARTHKASAPMGRFKRHHSYGPGSLKVNSPTRIRAQQKLEAIMRDIELEENRGVNNIKTRNNTGCGVCHQPVVFESTYMLDGIGYHPSCFVCVACGRSLRGKRICKAKDQLYCEEDFLFHGFRLTQRVCDHCSMPFISQDQVEAYTKIFHKQCFQCSECYSPLPSEQDSRLLEGRPVCVKCHLLVMYRQTAPSIRRTAQPIQGCSEML